MSTRFDKNIQLDREDLLTIKIPIKEGKLYHLNGAKWSRCHVVLGKCKVYIFDINHRGDEEVLSYRINTSDLTKVALHSEIMKEGVCFALTYGEGDTIVFACDSEATRTDWMKSINEVIHSVNNSGDSDFYSGGSLRPKENEYDEIGGPEDDDEDISQKPTIATSKAQDTVISESACAQSGVVYSRVRKQSSVSDVEALPTRDGMNNDCKDASVPSQGDLNHAIVSASKTSDQNIGAAVSKTKSFSHEHEQTYRKIKQHRVLRHKTFHLTAVEHTESDQQDDLRQKDTIPLTERKDVYPNDGVQTAGTPCVSEKREQWMNRMQNHDFHKESFPRVKKNHPYDEIDISETRVKITDSGSSGSQKTGDNDRKTSLPTHDKINIDDMEVHMEDLKLPVSETDPENNSSSTDELKSDETLWGNIFDTNSHFGDSIFSNPPAKIQEEGRDTKRDPAKQSCAQKERKPKPPPKPSLPSPAGNNAKEPQQSADTKQVGAEHVHENVGISNQDARDVFLKECKENDSEQSNCDEDYPKYECTNDMMFEKEEYACEKLNKKLLKSKPVGTFCVCKGRGTNQELAVKTDESDNISIFRITEEKDGVLYIKKGTAFSSLDDLLNYYSDTFLPSKNSEVTLKQGCFRNLPHE